jgi:type II secretion system protein D
MGSQTDVKETLHRAGKTALLTALLGIWAIAPSQVTAQVPEGTDPGIAELTIENGRISLSVNEATGVSLKDFIKLTEKITGKVITFSETDFQQPNLSINFYGTVNVSREQFFGFFQTMLYMRGFAVVIRGDEESEIVQIVSLAGPQRADVTASARYVPAEELDKYATQTGVQILTMLQLNHINAVTASTATRPFFAQSAQPSGGVLTGNLGDNRSMILQGFGPQVYAAYQLLKLSDVPPVQPANESRVVKLNYATAEELEPVLSQVLEDRARRVQQAQGAAGGQIQAAGGEAVKVLALSSLNGLLVTGEPERIVEALDLIARLDQPIEASGGDIHVIQLRNVLAQDLQQTLREFLREDQQAEQQAQAGQQAVARRPRPTVIVAHAESNSLLVSSTQSKFRQIERMIEELDTRQPQVLIEAALVELSTSNRDRLGVELGLLDLAEGQFQRPFGFTSFGLTEFEDTDDDGLPDTRLPNFTDPLQGLTGGIITSDDFAIPVVVNALSNDDRSNILSLPSIVVNNNEQALVKTEENRPTQTVSQGQATTQTGVGDPRTAGIELTISPSISSNDYLRLDIDITVSRFIGAADPTTGGTTISRQVQTQVTLPSGYTMVLGGIIEDLEAESESGIPLLKDIPLLGVLFRNRSDEFQKTNLYFFVTPTILNEPDFSDLQEVSQRKKLEAADYIGNRRLRILDSRWTGGVVPTLDDSRTTADDLDRHGGFDIPFYNRPTETPTFDGSQPSVPTLQEIFEEGTPLEPAAETAPAATGSGEPTGGDGRR